ncbi:mechanosensitive ion channel domain-containing protein [Synechococcus sp. PCC 7336]|uniref:mechanosensitive ion channel domain-containing protein n=1 Tax=Synechococcus sp. PCC 7336 TaxID=195250 RepID=UPI00034AADDB|nr:mechanosensitive ion channel domain-containing protein [Synechococcus sp. PCC 7336]
MLAQPVQLRSLRRWSGLVIAVAILLFGWAIAPLPVLAQSPLDALSRTAPVVLDGRELFRIHATDTLTASNRAGYINANLREALRSRNPRDLALTTDTEGLQANISAGGNHLLTVTERDTLPGLTPELQARLWERRLQFSLERALQERTPGYRRQALWRSGGILLGAIAIHLGLGFGHRLMSRRDRRQPQQRRSQQLARLMLALGLILGRLGCWLGVSFWIAELWPLLRRGRYQFLQFLTTSFQEPLIVTMGASGGFSLLDLMVLLGLLAGVWAGAIASTRLLKSQILQPLGAEASLPDGVATTIQYALLIVGTIAILQAWGLDLTSLTIVASVFSVGVGFGLQNIFRNFISGWVILLDRPVQVGDFVNIGSLVGTVERIGARSTTIRTLDRVAIVVPNSHILDREAINWSQGHAVSRLHVPLGVAYGSDIRQVRAVLLRAARSHPTVLQYPRPQVWFQGFGDSALNFELLVWLADPRQQFSLKSDLNYRIEANLRKLGVQVPFPQRDVHLRSPHLEKMAGVWLKQQVDSESLAELEELLAGCEAEERPFVEDAWSKEFLTPLQLQDAFTETQVTELVEKMRGEGGVEIRDRRYRLTTYRNCFVGAEAVEWLMENQRTTRENATQIGQILMDRGMIQHVLDEQPFLDRYLFYRFRDDAGDLTLPQQEDGAPVQ